MPNGGTDNCLFCPYNATTMAATEAERRQRVGLCTLRNIPVNNGLGVNSCVNHPHHNQLGITIPIGPIFVSSVHMIWRHIAVTCPDSEEIRTLLLSLLHNIQEEPSEEYGNGKAYTPDIVIWQLGEFMEQRALDDLWRIAAFDQTLTLRYESDRINERRVRFAEDAILKILCQEAPDPIGKQWPYEVLGDPAQPDPPYA